MEAKRGSERAALAAGLASNEAPSGPTDATAKKNKNKVPRPETKMVLPKFELTQDDDLKKVFQDMYRKFSRQLWKFLINPKVLQAIMKKAGLYVVVEEPSAEVLELENDPDNEGFQEAQGLKGRRLSG